MATTVQLSAVSDLLTSPPGVRGRGKHNAMTRKIFVTGEVATTSLDDIGDVVLLCELPWDSIVSRITLYNDDLDTGGTAGAVDVGLYKLKLDGTVSVLSAAAYASAITTLTAANTTGVNVAFEARDINKLGQQTVLTDAGLTANPGDGSRAVLGMTITTAMTTPQAGTVSVEVEITG